jgi:hypothetical protein
LEPRNRKAWLAGWALAVLAGCSAPPVAFPADQGHAIHPSALAGFQRGVTTRAEALAALGEPDSTTSDPADGSTTLAWRYQHTDASGTTTVGVLLRFDAEDRLLLKFASQNHRNR